MAADGGSILIKILGDDSDFSSAMSGVASVTSASVKVATAAIAAMGTAVVALGTIAFDYNKEIETYTTNFGVMLGDTEAAVEKVEELKTMAASTPFALADLASATEQLLAFGVASDDTETYLQQLGDISLGSTDKLNTLVSAFGKMNSTGKVTLETINMMSEQGFNPLQEISRTTGESMESLYDRVSAGTVTLDEITNAFDTATSAGGQFEDGMLAASQTTDGLISTLKDNATAMLGEIYEPITDGILQEVLPAAISGIDELTNAFRENGIDGLIEVGGELLGSVVTGISETLPQVTEIAVTIVTALAEQLVANAPEIALAAGELLTALSTGIFTLLPLMAELALELIINFGQYLAENANSLADGVVGMILTLSELITDNLPTIVDTAIDIILAVSTALLDNTYLLTDAATQLVIALIVGLLLALPDILMAWDQIHIALQNAIIDAAVAFAMAGYDLILSLWEGAKPVFQEFISWVSEKLDEILNIFGNIKDKFFDVGSNIVDGIWEGISDGWDWLINKVSSLADSLLEAAKSALGIHSPSTAFRDDFSGNIIAGGVVGIDDNKSKLLAAVNDMGTDILSDIDAMGIADAAMSIFGGADGTIEQLNCGVGVPTSGGSANSTVTYVTNNEYNTTIEGVDSDPDVIAKKIQDESEYGV